VVIACDRTVNKAARFQACRQVPVECTDNRKKGMTSILFEAWLLNPDEGTRAQSTTSSLSNCAAHFVN
jgi:hypothetical protein